MNSLDQNKNKQNEQNYFLFNAEEESLDLEGEINGLEEEKYLFTKDEIPKQETSEPQTEEAESEPSPQQKVEETPQGEAEADAAAPDISSEENNSASEAQKTQEKDVNSIGDILKNSSWFQSSEEPQQQQVDDIPGTETVLEQEQEIKQEQAKEETSEIPMEEATPEEKPSSEEETISFPKSKVALMKKLLRNVQENNEKLLNMFEGLAEEEDIQFSEEKGSQEEEEEENADNIIEGVFDGENMIGPDGRQYSVPTNYASKSKLVEGDILKLTIAQSGKFLYKQIHPMPRARIIGTLRKGNDGNFYVVKDDKKWKVLQASVTYFKGELGDEVSLLIPAEGDSKWGAIENIIKS